MQSMKQGERLTVTGGGKYESPHGERRRVVLLWRLPSDALIGNLAQVLQLVEILGNQDLAHVDGVRARSARHNFSRVAGMSICFIPVSG